MGMSVPCIEQYYEALQHLLFGLHLKMKHNCRLFCVKAELAFAFLKQEKLSSFCQRILSVAYGLQLLIATLQLFGKLIKCVLSSKIVKGNSN